MTVVSIGCWCWWLTFAQETWCRAKWLWDVAEIVDVAHLHQLTSFSPASADEYACSTWRVPYFPTWLLCVSQSFSAFGWFSDCIIYCCFFLGKEWIMNLTCSCDCAFVFIQPVFISTLTHPKLQHPCRNRKTEQLKANWEMYVFVCLCVF